MWIKWVCLQFWNLPRKVNRNCKGNKWRIWIRSWSCHPLVSTKSKQLQLQIILWQLLHISSLLLELRKRGILCAGTVRENQLSKPPLATNKAMKKKGQGTTMEVISKDGTVVITKWYDNKYILLASNFVGIGIVDLANRWSKQDKKYIDVQCPEAVKLYNSSMGGVDKFDFLISLYRTTIRSRKWTLRMIFHAVDMAVTNSWIEYKLKSQKLGIPNKKTTGFTSFPYANCRRFSIVRNWSHQAQAG